MTNRISTQSLHRWLQFLLPVLFLCATCGFFAYAQPGTTRKIDPATGKAVSTAAVAEPAAATQAVKSENADKTNAAARTIGDTSSIQPEQVARSVIDDSVLVPEIVTADAVLDTPKTESPEVASPEAVLPNTPEPVQAASVKRPVPEPLNADQESAAAEQTADEPTDTAANTSDESATAPAETVTPQIADTAPELTERPVVEPNETEAVEDATEEAAPVETEIAEQPAAEPAATDSANQSALEPHIADWRGDADKLAGIRAKAALAQAGTVSTTVSAAKPGDDGFPLDSAKPLAELDRAALLNNDPTAILAPGPAAMPTGRPVNDSHDNGGNIGTFSLPKDIQIGPNDVVANDAYATLPVGEGFDATVSANTQGKLIELGIEEKNPDGSTKLDENGNPVITPLRRGMMVKAGDVLGKQFNREFIARKNAAERELVVAQKEAEKTLEVDVAELAALVARSEYERAKNANRDMPGAIAEEEVVKRAYEWNRSVKSHEKAKYDLEINKDKVEVSKAQIEIADAQLEERRLVSPITGQVDEIWQNEGQWLREGDSVFRIIRLDKITIEARFDAGGALPDQIQGKKATVYASRPGEGLRQFEGVVTYARPILEHNHYKAYAEVQNVTTEGGSWFLIPGQQVHIVVHK